MKKLFSFKRLFLGFRIYSYEFIYIVNVWLYYLCFRYLHKHDEPKHYFLSSLKTTMNIHKYVSIKLTKSKRNIMNISISGYLNLLKYLTGIFNFFPIKIKINEQEIVIGFFPKMPLPK